MDMQTLLFGLTCDVSSMDDAADLGQDAPETRLGSQRSSIILKSRKKYYMLLWDVWVIL
jgi:hypothetical protein